MRDWFVRVFLAGAGLFMSSAVSAGERVQLLPNEAELPAGLVTSEVRAPGAWWAVSILSDGTQNAERVEVHFSAAHCPVPDSGCDEAEKRVFLSLKPEVPSCNFLVRGKAINPRVPLPNTGAHYPINLLPMNAAHNVQVGTTRYKLEFEGKMAGDQPSEAEVVLSHGQSRQVLWNLHRRMWDDPNFQLLWAGDLDRDQKPDLFLLMASKYTELPHKLFLSSYALPGKLVGPAGEFVLGD
jgi:hypothetical protein